MNRNVDLAERDSKIIEMRGEGKTAKEIANEIGVCNQTVFNVLKKYGLHEPRKYNKKSTSGKTRQVKRCPVCKAVNNPKEAKFCCMCGSDIRSESDVLIEKLNKSLKVCCSLLPTNSIEEVRDTILETIKYIEETNK